MASGDAVAAYNIGGRIDLIKEIAYPEQLMPKGANTVKRKGFKLVTVDATPVVITYTIPGTNPAWICELSVTPERCEDPDYWEFEVGTNKVCETMYTQEVSDGGTLVGNFEIYQRVEAGIELKFTFVNDSGTVKKVWLTLGYIFQNTV
jgi:hypothetical protein